MESRIKKTPVYDSNLKAYESHKYRLIANEGSTRSSKTVSICQLLSLYIPSRYKKSITVVSPSLPHLKRGARREFLQALQAAGVYRDNNFNKTDNIYEYPATGAYVEFFGVEDSNKVHGPGRDILYVNEANLISYDTYKQLAIRTNELIIIDYNPADEFSWVYTEADKPGNKIIHSTYRNNLGNLTKEIVEEIESLQYADENLWKVYGLGLRGTHSETIYTHWKQVENMPACDDFWYGLDFGYNNPSALVKVGILDKKIYVEEIFYETKLTTNDLSEVIKVYGITKSSEIFCDAAEPKTIEELKRMGLNAKSADKSVYDGIQLVKSYPLFITAGSTNIIKEIKSYKWKTDKDGKVVDEPVKFMDHCFVADTMVLTSKGNKRICDIKPNEKVITSHGIKTVLFQHSNGSKKVNKYLMQFDTFSLSLECTPNHFIKTNKGWQAVSELKPGAKIYLNKHLMGKRISFTPARDTFLNSTRECMLQFGNIGMARFLKVIMFIMQIIIHGIITLITLNLKKAINIFQNTVKRGLLKILCGQRNFMQPALQVHLNGMAAKMELNGIKNMVNTHGLTGSQQKQYVNIAAKNMNHILQDQNSVIIIARLKHLEQGESSLKPVYDITVEDAHEYFANGILVHNCMDALRYAVFTKLSKPKFYIPI